MGWSVEVLARIEDVDAACWDVLVPPTDPFTEHAFLTLLERSGSATAATGWTPCHLLLRRRGRLVGAAPVWEKTHSFGEYVFDFAWAEGAARAGLPYYPKLVVAVPATPATGGRLLWDPDADPDAVVARLLVALQRLAHRRGCSSVHVLLPRAAEVRIAMRHARWIHRVGYQFHWVDRGWSDFDAFLASLRAPARKKIRKERRIAASHGLALQTRSGAAVSRAVWQAIGDLYAHTVRRKGGARYLRPAFFTMAADVIGHRSVVPLALDADGEVVAAALALQRGGRLYGRLWGARQPWPMLHFELCYHRLVAWALEHGCVHFDAGAQGAHKLAREFEPTRTHSLHWFADRRLHRAVAAFVAAERRRVAAEIAFWMRRTPYRRDGRADGGAGT